MPKKKKKGQLHFPRKDSIITSVAGCPHVLTIYLTTDRVISHETGSVFGCPITTVEDIAGAFDVPLKSGTSAWWKLALLNDTDR